MSMKYYSEDETRDLRIVFEEKVLRWENVTKTKMFGCPCYKVNEKLFTFLVTKGVVITKLNENERETISSQYQTTPFQAGKKTVQKWIKLAVENESDLEKILPLVRKSYNNAVQAAKETYNKL